MRKQLIALFVVLAMALTVMVPFVLAEEEDFVNGDPAKVMEANAGITIRAPKEILRFVHMEDYDYEVYVLDANGDRIEKLTPEGDFDGFETETKTIEGELDYWLELFDYVAYAGTNLEFGIHDYTKGPLVANSADNFFNIEVSTPGSLSPIEVQQKVMKLIADTDAWDGTESRFKDAVLSINVEKYDALAEKGFEVQARMNPFYTVDDGKKAFDDGFTLDLTDESKQLSYWWNGTERFIMVFDRWVEVIDPITGLPELDANGDPVLEPFYLPMAVGDFGLYRQSLTDLVPVLDGNGDPVLDLDGNPVYEYLQEAYSSFYSNNPPAGEPYNPRSAVISPSNSVATVLFGASDNGLWSYNRTGTLTVPANGILALGRSEAIIDLELVAVVN